MRKCGDWNVQRYGDIDRKLHYEQSSRKQSTEWTVDGCILMWKAHVIGAHQSQNRSHFYSEQFFSLNKMCPVLFLFYWHRQYWVTIIFWPETIIFSEKKMEKRRNQAKHADYSLNPVYACSNVLLVELITKSMVF